jgi:hypothetical protein
MSEAWAQYVSFNDEDKAACQRVLAAIADDPLPRSDSITIFALPLDSGKVYSYRSSRFRYGVYYRIESVRGEQCVTIEHFTGPFP